MTKNMKMNGQSLNTQEDLLAWLKEKLPEAFTEGKIDPKKLKATLGESVDANNERYGLSWAGKNDCFRHIQEPTTATLKPVRDESADFDTTKNLFIEGDNMQVLKVLQKSYYGQVKMIYIDPPYNTGSDSFIYPDRFQETQEEYMERVGDKEEGHVTRDGMWQKNSGDNGHYHSNWLSMMYPRLFLARNLLRDDGLIFVSIDDHEVHNLRLLLNEIFGEENFIATFIWKKKAGGGDDSDNAAIEHEYIHCFAREINSAELGAIMHESPSMTAKYNKIENGHRYYLERLDKTSLTYSPSMDFEIVCPDGTKVKPPQPNSARPTTIWRWSKTKVQQMNDKLVFERDKKTNEWRVYTKTWAPKDGVTPRSLLIEKDHGRNRDGTQDIAGILEPKVFSNPKPIKLLRHILKISNCQDGDIVMDFFAGSCSLAHAILTLEDVKPVYIMIQIPEEVPKDSVAFASGYRSIADIGKERLRRLQKKLSKSSMDMGFKSLRLEESNFKIWRSNVSDAKELAEQMHMFIDNLKAESTQENVLYELMLKSGLDLNVPVESKKADGKKYFVLDNGKLVVCLEDAMTQPLADAVIALKPQKVICLDGAFRGNDQLKTNTALQMEAAQIDFRVI